MTITPADLRTLAEEAKSSHVTPWEYSVAEALRAAADQLDAARAQAVMADQTAESLRIALDHRNAKIAAMARVVEAATATWRHFRPGVNSGFDGDGVLDELWNSLAALDAARPARESGEVG